jgi:hypothetical protein
MRLLIFGLLIILTTNCFAQSNGQFVKEHKNNCKIWLDEVTPTDSLIWNGNCKNNFASGQGFLQWYQNNKLAATYNGEMKQGKFHGKGKFEIIGYATFEGTFINGALNGKGAAYFNNGGKTIGNFVNGDFLNLDDKYLTVLKKQYVDIKDSTEIYGNHDEVDKLFYYSLIPDKKIEAVLVLFPSTGETVENVISCNKELMQLAYDNNILSAVASANYNKTLESDKAAMFFFETVFEELITKFKAPKDKFILSGLSLGGENALQYTEMSRNKRYTTYVKPLAVIGVDPPVDYVTLYHHAKDEIALYSKNPAKITASKQLALNEDNFLIKYFHNLYGGSPEEFPDKYSDGSLFSLDHEDAGNAKYLIDVPVRIYCDPDVVWQLMNKGRDFYHMNAPDQSAMIRFLMLKGNKNAEFIQALGKGYRVDGTRHPHSWSIVDPADCIKWILELIK